MSKICPECKAILDDNMKFCSECGSRQEDNTEKHPLVNLGDANAINGGVHIDNSKTVDSHDVHYHTVKNEKETALELNARYQKEVIALCPNGVVSSEARIKLDSLKIQLGITNEIANQIEKNVRNAVEAKAKKSEQLSPAAQMVLDEAIESIEKTSPKSSDYIEKLAGLRKLTNNESVDFYYNMLLAAFEPNSLITEYKKHDADSYWKTFWACIAYRITDNKKQAEICLSELQVHWSERPEGDVVLNICVGILWDNEGILDNCKDRIAKYLKKCSKQNVSCLLYNMYSALEWLIDDTKKAAEEVRTYEVDKETGKLRIQRNVDDDYPLTVFYRFNIIPSTKDANHLYLYVNYVYDNDTYAKDEIIERYEKAAKYGSSDAMAALGSIYGERAEEFGFDEFDEEIEIKKIFWLKKAAQAGNVYAARELYEEYKTDNKYEAIEWLEIAARGKDSEAMVLLADEYSNYDESRIKIHDYYRDAVALYEEVISEDEFEDKNSKFGLGKMYMCGKGVEKDEHKGIELIDASANLGNLYAKDYLGCCYMNGCGVEKNYEKAIELFEQTIEKDDNFHTDALIHIGQCYLKVGDKQDNYRQAYEAFKKVTQFPSYKQNPEAHHWLAYCFSNGYGVETNLQKSLDCISNAVKCYDKKQMMPSALFYYHVADIYLKSKNVDAAKDTFIKAAEAGNADSMWRLACMYSDGYLKKDIKIADSWLKKAAEAGQEEALKRMASHGSMMEEDTTSSTVNTVLQEDTEEERIPTNKGSQYANELFIEAIGQDTLKLRLEKMPKAADAGSVEAMLFLAKAYISGVGVTRNENTARVWCKSAVDAGSEEASELLNAIEDSSYTIRQVALDYDESKRKYNCAFTNKGKRYYPAKIKRAAEDGSVDAMLFLAKHYRDGMGSYPMDSALAREWFQKAAFCGSDEARVALGMKAKESRQVLQDTEVAASSSASCNKNASANTNSVDLERAQKLYDAALNEQLLSTRISRMEKAAKAGSPDAMLFMAKAYISGVQTNRNERTAIEYCNKAIALGQKEASTLLQAIKNNSYTPEQVAINHEESYYKYKESFFKSGRINRSRMKQAAEGGSVDAMLFLAKAYRDGSYDYEADEQYSRMWFQKAAYCGSNEARKVLGVVSKNTSSSQSEQNKTTLSTATQSETGLKNSREPVRRNNNASTTTIGKTEKKIWWTKPWALKIVLALACIVSLDALVSGFGASQIFYSICLWVAYVYMRIKAKNQ